MLVNVFFSLSLFQMLFPKNVTDGNKQCDFKIVVIQNIDVRKLLVTSIYISFNVTVNYFHFIPIFIIYGFLNCGANINFS